MKVLDRCGRPIEVGDRIYTFNRRGSCLRMRVRSVERIEQDFVATRDQNGSGCAGRLNVWRPFRRDGEQEADGRLQYAISETAIVREAGEKR